MQHLHGKRVVITGSSRGLGRAFATEMARQGAVIVLNGTNPTALAEAERAVLDVGGRATSVCGSVALPEVVDELIETCIALYGGIDILINNAGIVRDHTLLKMTLEEFDEVIAVHLRGSFLCAQRAALAMRGQGSGHIVNVVSNSGLSGGFGQSNYAAAKAGMMGMLRTWMLELARYNIRVNAFWPIADTDMTQVVFEHAARAAASEGKAPPSREALGFGSATEVAQGMVWLTSDAAAHFNGQCLTFSGRKTALWTHPREVHETFSRDALGVDQLSALYRDVTPEPLWQPRFVE